jgi:uncharacterized protein (TIGR02099 family)
MLNSRPVRLLWHSFNWLTRITLVCAAAGAIMLALGIIVLRYWLLPDIEQYHEKITTSITRAIGRPVTIEKIAGDWQGLRPSLSLVNLAILDDQRNPALVLPSVRVSVSWLSLLTAELRFASLEIDRPELLIRRDVQGNLFVGSVAVVPQEGGDNSLSDWLLHQSHMVARNALIVWLDEQRGAPPLVLENVDVRIESLFNHHRFALRAMAPAELASPLDVRGDFRGASFTDIQNWRGQLFTQFQYADITAWRPWFDMPKEFSRGRGALRGWLDVTAGKVSRLQVDLAVRDVVTRLADDVPELILRSLQGRATWQALDSGFELETKKLTMQVENGVALPTTDLYLRILNARAKQPASGEIRANLLQLETLVSLANFVPIPDDLRAELDAFAPRGKVENLQAQWQGKPQHLQGFLLKGRFQNIALRQVGKLPGFSGLTAEIDGDQNSGKLRIKSHQLHVDAPGIMRDSLVLHTLSGSVSWQHQDKELRVDVDSLALSNVDLEGKAHGSYRTLQGTPGVLDLVVDLSRADIHQAARYMPLTAMNRKVNDWLHEGLLAGSSNDFHLRILGNLNDFPFDQAAQGKFEISAQLQGAAVQFAKGWPMIENANGKFLMSGKKLELLCTEATTVGVPLRDISVLVPDITLPKTTLEAKVQAAAGTRDFLQYIQRSPVRGYTKGFTDTIRAKGEGALELALRIPQLGENPVEVQGVYHIYNNEVDLGGRVPVMRKVNGELRFSQTGLQTHQVTAQILGGSADIDVKTTPTGAVAVLSGTGNLDIFSQANPHPLFNYLHGSTAWNAQVVSANKSLHVQINSSLQGIASTLPAPFAKAGNESLPLSLELKSSAALKERGVDSQNDINIELGKLLSARVVQQTRHGVDGVKRATINFGGQGKWPEQDGIWLVGILPELSVQGLDGLFSQSAQGESGAIPVDGADIQIAKLSGYGYAINDLHVAASKRGDGLAVQLDSQALNGEVVWQPHGYQNAAKLSAHLKNLYWPADTSVTGVKTNVPSPETRQVLQPGILPTLDVDIDDLQVTDKHIGRLELAGNPDGENWRLRRLILTNPDGSLSGDGVWLGGAGNPQTKINLMLEIGNAGKILDRSGYPNTVKDGNGKLLANLVWVGAPEAFNLKTLEGTLKLDTGKGQFLKIDPGAGKLLSVLSLQALPKHIALDFTDVFSEGFQFENINGNAVIHDGQMTTQDFRIDGSAAKITMKGGVNLIQETQDLRVDILPNIGGGVSLITALAINPIFGVSAFVVDKLLGNPLDKLVSFEYNISGTWADPSVVKVGEKYVPIRIKETAPVNAIEPVKVPVSGQTDQPITP